MSKGRATAPFTAEMAAPLAAGIGRGLANRIVSFQFGAKAED
ncbi:hypothetical protein [Nitrospirillum pindoramense]|uniref:Uncharacterized protein n=1 Tax=Nitrospirillum amazonense TaxID=28077 RepID=A0A560H0B4_9PROT|nr:hypothetical protein [Nitrospirillum amazonense]TWB39194.1 hypothetical protein FBZ90_111191 [Nitrospirillum amazonense]